MSADAKDLTNPDVGGMTRAIVGCLKDAGLTPDDIDYINAHGTGTLANDLTETQALKAALGDRAGEDPGIVDQVDGRPCARCGRRAGIRRHADGNPRQRRPADHRLPRPDPACDLDYVPNEARPMKIDVAMSNSFAFGGLNAVLAARRFA